MGRPFSMFISRQDQFDEFVQQLKFATQSGAPLAFDTEFLSEKRYYSRLCLVQVLAPTPNGDVEACLDPFTLDLTQLLEIIADETVVKIVHSGSADLQILFQNFGITPKNIFDTQIAAAFLGYGHQIGYADLVRKITSAQISKTMQYTDWSMRPLSEEQIEYALADVRHLPPIYRDLTQKLKSRGRLEWAFSEFEKAEARSLKVQDDNMAYRRLSLNGLTRKQLSALRGAAKAREELARNADRPPSFFVPDLALVQLARQQPKNVADMRAIRGMPGISDKDARRVLAALDEALKSDPATWPESMSHERPDPRLESLVALLGVVVGSTATAHDVSRNYLGKREEQFELAKWWLEGQAEDKKPEIDLLDGWRYELVGKDLIRLLNGELVIQIDKSTGLPQMTAKS
jgi:ribonuclease D